MECDDTHKVGWGKLFFLKHFILPYLNLMPACKPELVRAAIIRLISNLKQFTNTLNRGVLLGNTGRVPVCGV